MEFLDGYLQKFPISNFTEMRPVRAALTRSYMDGYDETNRPLSRPCELA